MSYRAPVADYDFIFGNVLDFDQLSKTELFAETTEDVRRAIVAEAGRLAEDVIAPVNRLGDQTPAQLQNGVVRSSPGYAEAYRAIADGGWVGISASPEHGGLGQPMMLNTAVNEMFAAGCLALQLNPLLTQGQIEAIEHHASEEIKALYLPKLTSGEWSGTMNLTESGAGSDVGALRTKAEDNGDGTYAVTGQKIFITWGDADYVDNVCHLVLARLPDGAPGTKGISLFIVPKLIPDANGKPGVANSLRVVSIEHKLGLHGSPTCVMEFDHATGWLVGEKNGGMKAMFTMMNNARLGVGAEGIGIAEAAFQHALAYAEGRVQGKTPVPGKGTIADHADVRRMLVTMKAQTFAARCIALACAHAIDMARATGDADWDARAALLTPIAKAFGTDTGMEVAQMGVQVHGGMGFIEETGAAQFARDVRVTAIYEGTNGIQAMDLVARKMMDGGESAERLFEEVRQGAEAARGVFPNLASSVWEAVEALEEATEQLLTQEMNDRFAGAVPYLRAFALVLGAHYHLRAALAAGADSPRAALAAAFIQRLLPEHAGFLEHAGQGAAGLYAISLEDLAA